MHVVFKRKSVGALKTKLGKRIRAYTILKWKSFSQGVLHADIPSSCPSSRSYLFNERNLFSFCLFPCPLKKPRNFVSHFVISSEWGENIARIVPTLNKEQAPRVLQKPLWLYGKSSRYLFAHTENNGMES